MKQTERFQVLSTYLNFLAEPGGLDLNEGGRHGPHVAGHVVEGDAARPDGILVLVRVQSRVDDAAEEVVEHHGQGLGRHHPVQCSNKHGGGRVQPVGLGADEVGVRQHPGDDLDLLGNGIVKLI